MNREEWRDIYGFKGYQISNLGQVRTFWRKKHYDKGYGTYRYLSDQPMIMSQTDDGNGYMKVCLYSSETGKRYCKKVHKLVADAFIPISDDEYEYTVDHIKSGKKGKLDNSVTNLRWLTRRENIQKAYRDGCCDERIRRSRKPICVLDLWTNDELYFQSIKDVADYIGVNQSTISHALRGDMEKVKHYIVEYAGREEKLLYGREEYYY